MRRVPVPRRLRSPLRNLRDTMFPPPGPKLPLRGLGPPHRVEIGRWTYGDPTAQRYRGDRGDVRIGAFCSIAYDVEFWLGGNHPPRWVSTFPFRMKFGMEGAFEDGLPTGRGPIVVGNDVWLGYGATILSGVSIGDGAIVGAHAVVGRDVRPYAIVIGNPAQEISRRFTDDQVDALLRIKWWDWPEDKIRAEVGLLSSHDIDEFIAKHDPGR